jgi:hypothetical protein
MVHHLLTLYALGAPPETIQKQYDKNKSYQRPLVPVNEQEVAAMHDPKEFKMCLGNEKYYHDYLIFFQREMEEKGWKEVVNEYLFKGDERAEDMLVRLHAGISIPRFREISSKMILILIQ